VISPVVIGFILVASIATNPGQTNAIAFPADQRSVAELEGTYRVPYASGTVKVEPTANGVNIRLQADDLMPAALFGGDYNTYVVWLVAENGQTDNVGELLLNGDQAEVDFAIELSTFGILVTAEPHFMVRAPSHFVVMEFKDANQKVQYEGFTGVYNFKRDSLAGLKEAKGDVRSGVQQALTALRLAQKANAPEFAPEEFDEAKRAFDSIVVITNHGTAGSKNEDEKARDAVRLAVDAETVARQRALAGMPRSGF
jgi:hypothetical protein